MSHHCAFYDRHGILLANTRLDTLPRVGETVTLTDLGRRQPALEGMVVSVHHDIHVARESTGHTVRVHLEVL